MSSASHYIMAGRCWFAGNAEGSYRTQTVVGRSLLGPSGRDRTGNGDLRNSVNRPIAAVGPGSVRPNNQVNSTAKPLRALVPSALRAPAARYLNVRHHLAVH